MLTNVDVTPKFPFYTMDMYHYIIILLKDIRESQQPIEITPVRLDPPTSNRVKIHLNDDDFCLFDYICNTDVR